MHLRMDIQDKNSDCKLNEIIETIEYHINNEMIIKIKRENIDDNEILGFPLGLSEEILLISRVVDFRDDGCLIIRLKDITDAYSLESNSFYEEICKKEGVRAIAQNENPITNISDLHLILSKLVGFKGFVSIQCELEDNELYYVIGEIISVQEKEIKFRSFDLQGKWTDKELSIPIDDITMVGFNDNYSKMFYKYMS